MVEFWIVNLLSNETSICVLLRYTDFFELDIIGSFLFNNSQSHFSREVLLFKIKR